MTEIKFVDLSISLEDLNRIINCIKPIFEKGSFILDDIVLEFEKELSNYCGTQYTVTVNSGTDAIFLVLKALDIGPGDEVITVANTFIATVGAIVATGAKPILVDVEYDTQLIDSKEVEKNITERTKAVIPVHLAGLCCNMDPILELADKYNLFVIEDAAQAIGAIYKGKMAGSMGVAGCFSLNPLKNLGGIGDGGAIITNAEWLYHKLILLRNHGLFNRDKLKMWGYNSRLDSINAAVLLFRLKKLDIVIRKKHKLALLYYDLLKDLKYKSYIDFYIPKDISTHVYHLFMIKCLQRNKLYNYLRQHSVDVRIHYPIPINKQYVFISKYGYIKLKNTELLAEQIISLPIHSKLLSHDIEKICDLIYKFYEEFN